MTTLLVAYLDGDLIAQAQRVDRGVEDRPIGAGIDQGSQRHVAGNAGEAVEVSDRHARVLLMCTAADVIGTMLAGRLATRTLTAVTPGRGRTRSAIRARSVSSSLTDSPSLVCLAIPCAPREATASSIPSVDP